MGLGMASRGMHAQTAADRGVGCKAIIAGRAKTIHFMRHGVTEMNTFLKTCSYDSPGFRDPLFYDTRLTEEGITGAKQAAAVTRALDPQPDVLVVSPLTRAIHTAHHAFDHFGGPIVIQPLARERVWLSSDCGRTPPELRVEFPCGRWGDFSHLDQIWWYTGGSADPKTIILEPVVDFKERVEEFRAWLMTRPESTVAVVAHWGLLAALTTVHFDNSEVKTFEMDLEGALRLVEELEGSSRTAHGWEEG